MKFSTATLIVGALFVTAIFGMNKPPKISSDKFVTADTSAKPKLYSMSMPLEGWQNFANYLQYISQQLKQTELPARQVSFITDSLIAPMQVEINRQIAPQVAKDTVKKK